MFRLLYPEARHVSAEWVLSQGNDAKVNAAVDEHVRQHGPFSDDDAGDLAYGVLVTSIPAPDLDEARALLEDLGLATFGQDIEDGRELDGGPVWEDEGDR